MALRRQGLSQRRKAVGLTQESLAQRLGVERSTVVRWEAGDTAPLPSIRPKVARALQVSVDQLAELLTEPDNAGTTRARSVDDELAVPVLLPDRTGLADPVHPQVADPVEALRQALRSAGVVPENLGAMLMAGRTQWVPRNSTEPGRPVVVGADVGSDTPATTTIGGGASIELDIPEPARTEVSPRPPLTAIAWDVEPAAVPRRGARSRRFARLAMTGALAVLAFAGGAVSVPLITSHRDPVPSDAIGPPAPVAAIPVPDFGGTGPSGTGATGTGPTGTGATGAASTGAGHPVPAVESSTPADTPRAAAAPAPRTIRSDKRTTSRPKPRAATTRPAPSRNPAIPPEAEVWLKRFGERG